MKSRLLNVVVSSLAGSASGFFAFRNEERKKYEEEKVQEGYRLAVHQHPATHLPTATGGGMGSTSYSWKKGAEEQPYDRRHLPFKL